MKKFLSMVTALCCTASLMAVLPAKAEEQGQTFIVIAVNDPEQPKSYVVSDMRGYTFWLNGNFVEQFTDETFTAGDIIKFHNVSYGSTEKFGTNYIRDMGSSSPDASVKKTGSILENPEIEEFTVNLHKEDYSETPVYCNLHNDTAEYNHFWLDWGTAYYWQPDQYQYEFLQDGDTVSCYTYEGRPYIMINTSQEDTFQDFLYLGADENKSVLMDENNQTYYLDTEKMQSYFFTDFQLKFGSVLRFRNLLPYAPDELIPDMLFGTIPMHLTETEGKSSPAIAYRPEFLNEDTQHYSTKFDVSGYDDNVIFLSGNGKEYTFRADFIKDSYEPEHYSRNDFMNREQIIEQETVFCLTWRDRPVIAMQETARDYLETAYVIGVDNPENPQQYVLKKDTKYIAVFTKEELAPYLPENTVLKTGDVLQFQNLALTINGNNYHSIEIYSDTAEGRPNHIEVSGSVLESLTLKEMTLWAKNPKYTRVRDENNKDFDLYPVPEGFDTFPIPDISGLKQGDKVTCLLYDNRIIALYDGKITPTGDADGSGDLDILDIITVNKAILGKETIPDEIIPYIDFNQNGKPDSDDALTMLKKIIGLA